MTRILDLGCIFKQMTGLTLQSIYMKTKHFYRFRERYYYMAWL